MSGLDNLKTNSSKVAFTSALDTDRVLEIFTGRISVPTTGSGSLALFDTYNTGINDLTYPVGIFSVDGGNGTDMGSHYLVGSSYLSLVASTQNNVLNVSAINFDAPTHSVAYKIAILAKPSNTTFTLPNNLPVNTAYLDSRINYQKIALEATIPIIVPAGNGTTAWLETLTVPIPHNLGYRPNVRSFVDDGTSLTLANGTSFSLLYRVQIACRIKIDNNNVNFVFLNSTASPKALNLSYRIYYDPNKSV